MPPQRASRDPEPVFGAAVRPASTAETEWRKMMRVAEVMSRNVQLAKPDDSLQDVAKRMASGDIGFMPVGENDRLVGTITDRDIVARAVAQGRDGKTKVRDVMSGDVKYCFDDEDVDHVIKNLGDL